MLVVCINNEGVHVALTIGKKYSIINECNIGGGCYFMINNDLGKKRPYNINRFRLLSEIRKRKLSKVIV